MLMILFTILNILLIIIEIQPLIYICTSTVWSGLSVSVEIKKIILIRKKAKHKQTNKQNK